MRLWPKNIWAKGTSNSSQRRNTALPLVDVFLKLSRNSSSSWDWLGEGGRPLRSLEDRSLSDQEVHRVLLVSTGQAISLSPTLFSENRASICLMSRSDTASPFKVVISLPFLSPENQVGNRKKEEGEVTEMHSLTKLSCKCQPLTSSFS